MTGAGIILLNSNNEVLLILRDNKQEIPYPNMWDIPGGMVEKNETAVEAIKREIYEELGLKKLGKIKLFNIFTSENITDYIFWKKIDLIPEEIELKEGQKIKYFNKEQIENIILAFNYNEVMDKFFKYLKNDE
jgi:8-oxo-dGTP diphosphatase